MNWTMFWTKKKIFDLTNPQKLDNLMLRYPKLSHFQVLWYPLPLQKILFFAYLYNLEQEKKRCENDPILSRPPSPQYEISHFF